MNLSTNYLGLTLNSPVVISASPFSEELSNIIKMEEFGAGAVVLFSLFEEQIDRDPAESSYSIGKDGYLELVRKAKKSVSIPVIGSLNGHSDKGWIDFAVEIEEAGADALELNIYFIPTEPDIEGTEIEDRYTDIVRSIKLKVKIPVAVKLNPYFSSTANMASKLVNAGADGLVLFNRFYQPDFDIEQMKVISTLKFSTPSEIRLPLLWMSLLHGRINTSLAATTGVDGPNEVIKYLLAGADVVMITSTLYKHGIPYITHLNHGVEKWMQSHGYNELNDFRGLLSHQEVEDPTAFQRANYIKILETFK